MAVSNEQQIEAVKAVLSSLFASQRTLKALAPQFRWAGLGNLLGDYGEFIAMQVYGLRPASRGANGFDATRSDGKTVQVKTNQAASQIGFRGEADFLLCLKIDLNGDWTEVFYGDFQLVKMSARYSARDNKYMLPVSTLKKIRDGGYKLPVPPESASLPNERGTETSLPDDEPI